MFTNEKYICYGLGSAINFIKIALFGKMHNKIYAKFYASSTFVYRTTMQMNLINPAYIKFFSNLYLSENIWLVVQILLQTLRKEERSGRSTAAIHNSDKLSP